MKGSSIRFLATETVYK